MLEYRSVGAGFSCFLCGGFSAKCIRILCFNDLDFCSAVWHMIFLCRGNNVGNSELQRNRANSFTKPLSLCKNFVIAAGASDGGCSSLAKLLPVVTRARSEEVFF